jgi:hypothetical protein
MLNRALVLLVLLLPPVSAPAEDAPMLSTAIGTQTIGPRYKFTDESALVETAKRILELGSDTLKIAVTPNYEENYRFPRDPEIRSVMDLVRRIPDYERVLDLPFRNLMLWLYPFSDRMSGFNKGEIPADEAEAIYRELRDFTAHLLRRYSGTGKSFYLGNWEGDWHVLKLNYDYELDPTPESIRGAIQWFNLRQKAIADAIRETEHHEVKVYYYVELNHVRKSMEAGRPTIVNSVLPHIRTDFVSWSSYDVTTQAAMRGGKDGEKMVLDALDYIERHLPPSDIKGRRVFIGEYGFTLEQAGNPENQAEYSRRIMRWGLEWGCPFVLYWELYCNEINEAGKHRGFWLIDRQGVKQPAWKLHHDFLAKANRFVEEFTARTARRPTQDDFNRAAVEWLAPPP